MDICLSSPSSCTFRVSAVKLVSSRTKSNRTKFPIKPTESYSQSLLNSSKSYSSTFRLSECTSCSRWGVSHRHSRSFSIWGCSGVEASGSDPGALHKVSEFKDAIWRFLRPHTIRGTALGSFALVSKALIENPNLIKWSLVTKALCGLFALICGNGYIVGINQIYDIGIDKVNKPYLPIAAGDLSVQSAWFLVLFFAVAGLSIVLLNFGPFISSLYSLGLFLGTIYSVPPLRLKRFPVAAFLIIATVRGFLLNFGVYYATRAALGLAFEWSSPVAFITTFVTVFALVIAITKDLPDVEGDRKFQISTFATKLGVRNIALLGSGLLLVNYIGAIFAAIYFPQAFRSRLMIPLHAFLAMGLIFQILPRGIFELHDCVGNSNVSIFRHEKLLSVARNLVQMNSNRQNHNNEIFFSPPKVKLSALGSQPSLRIYGIYSGSHLKLNLTFSMERSHRYKKKQKVTSPRHLSEHSFKPS